jgi:hypothetical protein
MKRTPRLLQMMEHDVLFGVVVLWCVIMRRPVKGGKKERVVERVCLRWLIWFCVGIGWWKRRPF